MDRVITNLTSDAKLRKETEKEAAESIEKFIVTLTDLKKLKSGKFDLVNISLFLFFYQYFDCLTS